MRCLLTILVCLYSTLAHADANTFSRDRITAFYDAMFCEEKGELSAAGLMSACPNINPPNPVPPPNRPATTFMAVFLQIVIVNNSTLPDSQVYVVLTGADQTTTIDAFVSINPSTGVGTLVTANPGDNALNYGLQLSQLPAASTGRVVYLPFVIGGEVWFSMNQKLNMPVNAPHNIVQPNFLSPSDPNYFNEF